MMFELEKYGGVMFDYTETDAKFEGKLTCTFKNDTPRVFPILTQVKLIAM